MKRVLILLLVLSGVLLLYSLPAQATLIDIFNTGVNGSNVVLSDGAIDPHYSITSSADPIYTGPTAYVANHPSWIANSANSKWIAPSSDASLTLATGNYTYRTTFDLTGLIPTTATLNGNWSTDNPGVDILINGASTSNTINDPASYLLFHSFVITTGFINGINTLDFIVKNNEGPTGLRVEIAGTATPTPLPSTMLLLGSGLAGLVGIGRWRFKK